MRHPAARLAVVAATLIIHVTSARGAELAGPFANWLQTLSSQQQNAISKGRAGLSRHPGLADATIPTERMADVLFSPRAQVRHVAGSTRKVCQLTGERDLSNGGITLSRTETYAGLWGAELGAPVIHQGSFGRKILFFFGDSWGVDRTSAGSRVRRAGWGTEKSVASTADFEPDDCLGLRFVTDGGTSYRPVDIGSNGVPAGGFSAYGKVYVFFAAGDHGVLTRTEDEGRTFRRVYEIGATKFVQVSPFMINNADVPGLPSARGQGVLLWGSGPRQRASNAYLAWVPLDRIEDRDAWVFYAGPDRSGAPSWATQESKAVPLFGSWPRGRSPDVRELSVDWNPVLGKWLLFYGGVNFRSSSDPWGAWGDEQVLFDGWRDRGYCDFMHGSRPTSSRCSRRGQGWYEETSPAKPARGFWCDADGRLWESCDGARDVDGDEALAIDRWESGRAHAPYMIPAFTREGADGLSAEIYFTLSTGNPHQTMLMKTTLAVASPDRHEPNDSPEEARLLSVPAPGSGKELMGSIDREGDNDHYRFETTGPVRFRVTRSAAPLTLKLLGGGDMSTGPSPSLELGAAGTHVVRVESRGVGAYRFRLEPYTPGSRKPILSEPPGVLPSFLLDRPQ